ncbi:hypothetical protein NEIG_02394 [Nematocida sp. ERTm5]|nr:hypothetical protein NEIRO02_2472 [Nematocida sp. AWRm79]KAI5169375.1 hypothetical protein NEIRO02_2663 [Nematocida sp. AWRm79]KAI5187021.1 hypothetical protein NEIRO03_2438 [Nematocida sp. AWRm78]OAG31372.1 hypothetical protein NEIG_02394 [Nematocida sp. ERTm5]
MDLLQPNVFRLSLCKLFNELDTLSKNTSVISQSITINKRKNALLLKDIKELKKRKEEQTNLLNKEENILYKYAKVLSTTEDIINQTEIELSDINTEKNKLISILNNKHIQENELILGIYEGCISILNKK